MADKKKWAKVRLLDKTTNICLMASQENLNKLASAER